MTGKKLAEIVAISLTAGFVAASGFAVFSHLFSATGMMARTGFYGAFMGAFFAFLFVRLSDALRKIYDRRAKHHNALVRLQHHFNDCLNIIGDNIYIIDTFFQIFDKYDSDAKERKVFQNELHEVPIDPELVVALANVELVNEIYTIHVELRKLNDSMNTANRIITNVTNSFVSGQINHSTYAANINHCKSSMSDLRKFSIAAKCDVIQACAAVRVLSRDAPFLIRGIRFLMPRRYTRTQRNAIEREKESLEREIDDIARKSRERINAVGEGRY